MKNCQPHVAERKKSKDTGTGRIAGTVILPVPFPESPAEVCLRVYFWE